MPRVAVITGASRGIGAAALRRYIGPYFTPDGRVDLDIARRAVDAVATELGVASVPADEIYQPAR